MKHVDFIDKQSNFSILNIYNFIIQPYFLTMDLLK